MLLTLSGKSLAGKDTLADVLVKRFGFHKVSWADEVKIMCSEIFSIPIEYFYDTELKDKREGFVCGVNHSFVSNLISYLRCHGYKINNNLKKTLQKELECVIFETPRQMMTHLGTDICRKYIDDDIWINLTLKKIESLHGSVIVPDSRFINEINKIKDLGGYAGLVIREGMINENSEGHCSEDVPDFDYDFIFKNNSNRASFQESVELWYGLRTQQELINGAYYYGE